MYTSLARLKGRGQMWETVWYILWVSGDEGGGRKVDEVETVGEVEHANQCCKRTEL